jgi:hypothetical protein
VSEQWHKTCVEWGYEVWCALQEAVVLVWVHDRVRLDCLGCGGAVGAGHQQTCISSASSIIVLLRMLHSMLQLLCARTLTGI